MEEKIGGTYNNYVDNMTRKSERKRHSINGSFIVLDSYYGDRYSKTLGKRLNFVSYSSQVFAGSTVAS